MRAIVLVILPFPVGSSTYCAATTVKAMSCEKVSKYGAEHRGKASAADFDANHLLSLNVMLRRNRYPRSLKEGPALKYLPGKLFL